jgi:fructokinase
LSCADTWSRERTASPGEWGHNPLPWPLDEERTGPACHCGRHGCIETFVSGPALVADFERGTGYWEGSPEIVARPLAGVINLLDPDVIVLGGGLSNIERLYEHVPNSGGGPSLPAASSQPPVPRRPAPEEAQLPALVG